MTRIASWPPEPTSEEREMFDTDRLHPDLQPYLVTSTALGVPMLKSPLVVTLLPAWKTANTLYLAKKERFEGAMARGDYADAIRLIEKPFALDVLRDWYRAGVIDRLWLRRLLPGTWSNVEPDDTNRIWLTLWRRAAGWYGHEMVPMLEDPLPEGDPLPIMRGQGSPDEKQGIAWTLNEQTARFFARRFREESGGGVVLAGLVPRSEVLGYITRRSEAEVIVNPDRVTLVDVTLEPGTGRRTLYADADNNLTVAQAADASGATIKVCGMPDG